MPQFLLRSPDGVGRGPSTALAPDLFGPVRSVFDPYFGVCVLSLFLRRVAIRPRLVVARVA